MKSMLLTFFLSLFAIAAFGQDKIDVVYLKDGRIITGSIVKPLDAEGVQIMTLDSEVYTFSAKEVLRVTREEYKHDNLKNKVFVHDGEGFTNSTFLGYGFGIGTVGDERGADNDQNYFAIHTVTGYHVSRRFSLGAGVGIELYGDYDLLPLYADVRYFPSVTEWAPFFYGNLGYGLGILDDNADGGMLFALGGGVQRSINPNLAFIGSFGYRYQENGLGTLNLNASFLQLSAGIKF